MRQVPTGQPLFRSKRSSVAPMSAGHGVLSTGAHRAGSLRSEGSNSPQGGSGSNTPTRHGSRDQTQQGSSGPPASKKMIGRRGRATLAETWALSGKEAMALALSQGRFDRQMERHTEGLRTDLQASLDQAEGFPLNNLLCAALLFAPPPIGSSPSRSAATAPSPHHVCIIPA